MGNENEKVMKIRSALLGRGMTMADFAVANGWNPVTVRDVVRRHCCGGIQVRGILTKAILDKLHETVNGELQ
jgi:lambda repressor-like predicted transcriptional regulator